MSLLFLCPVAKIPRIPSKFYLMGKCLGCQTQGSSELKTGDQTSDPKCITTLLYDLE